MHLSALTCMHRCIEAYLDRGRAYDVLDFGSFVNTGQQRNHRLLFDDYRVSITGVDIQAGRNVDVAMTRPYTIPLRSNSMDVVLTGQVFEHIPFPFASMLEIARVLRPDGLLFMTVPSRGHRHSTYDLWRFYPDALRAFAAFSELELLEAHTDWPPRENGRFVYDRIDPVDHYWGDTTGVFRKPHLRRSLRRRIHREVVLRHANRVGGLEGVPLPTAGLVTRAQREELARRLESRLAARGTPAAEE